MDPGLGSDTFLLVHKKTNYSSLAVDIASVQSPEPTNDLGSKKLSHRNILKHRVQANDSNARSSAFLNAGRADEADSVRDI